MNLPQWWTLILIAANAFGHPVPWWQWVIAVGAGLLLAAVDKRRKP